MKFNLGLALALSLGALSWQAGAAEECLLGPAYLPGLSGPPVWLNPGGGAPYRAELHDPRWAGSPLRFHEYAQPNNGGLHIDDGAYRVVESGGYLYVSAQAIADDGGLSTSDRVYFAFTRGTAGTGAFALRIDGDTTTAAEADPPSGPNIDVLARVNSLRVRSWETTDATVASPTWTGSGAGTVPPWLDQVAVWRSAPGVVWGVTFRINLSNGANQAGVTGAFKVFHGLTLDQTGGTDGIVHLGSSSISSGSFIGAAEETRIPLAAASWNTTLNASAGVCASGIYPSAVGVASGASVTSDINACGSAADPCPAGGQTNKFRAIVQNVPDPGAQEHTIRARIRYADWGAIAADWANPPWKDIKDIPANVLSTPAASLSANWDFGWTGGVATIDYTCVVQAGDGYCPKVTNSAYPHQCVFVELAADPEYSADPAYLFKRSSMAVNMNFIGLSKASREATIDTTGLPLPAGEERDVYLVVQATNMPAHQAQPIWQNQEAMQAATAYAANPPPVPPQADGRDLRRNYTAEQLRAMGKQRTYGPESARRAAARAKAVSAQYEQQGPIDDILDVPTLTGEQAMSNAWPTYRVRVYYDSGTTTKNDDGAVRHVLVPMTHFGLYLKHEGELYGFSHELQAAVGETTTLEKLSPTVYRIKLAKDGKAHLNTTLTAHEEPPPTPACDCDKCCAKKDHEHTKVPPHKHCLCSTPGFGERGWSGLAVALGLGSLLLARRRLVA
jgi:hypothetical protein